MGIESGNKNEFYKESEQAALRVSRFLGYGIGHNPPSSPEEHAPGIAEKLSLMAVGGEETYDAPDGKEIKVTRTAAGYDLSDFKL